MEAEPGAELRVGLLGPLVVRVAGRSVDLPAGRVRTLFAALAVADGEVVAIADLAARLWAGGPAPERPRAALHSLVRRLRRALGDALVQTVNDGYRLVVSPGQVDAHRFHALVAAAATARLRAEDDQERLLLREALALWRGPALADVAGPTEPAAELAAKRRAALGRLLELERHTGRLGEVVAELRELVAAYPVHEPFRHQLVLALARLGHTDEAIAEYDAGLVALGGSDTGPGADYLALRTAIGSPPRPEPAVAGGAPALVPRQLPPQLADFVGRDGPLRSLLDWLRGSAGSTGVPVAVVSGAPGAGKTTLAVHAAHRLAAEFGDGQLYANLHGYSAAAPVGTAQVLGRFLRAFGVPEAGLPTDVDELAALYRTVLADRRVLVLLDNAAGADQVLPLLPAGPGCAVLVTSRSRLNGLTVAAAARPVTLGPMRREESVRLLAGAGVTGPASTVDELAALCADTPLALRLAAAQLAGGTPGGLAGYVAALRADRLGALDAGDSDEHGVAAAVGLSYRALPEPARRLFRLLGLVPARTWELHAVAALLGADPPVARRLLHQLAAVSLLAPEPTGDRFRLHDLLRWYAAERAAPEEPANERTAAQERLLAWATGVTGAAIHLVHPDLELEPLPEVGHGPFDGAQAAARWLDAERDNLLVLLEHAATTTPARVWPLPALLHPHLAHGNRRQDGGRVVAATLRAAAAIDDPLMRCAGLTWRGGDALQAGDLGTARDSLTEAGRIAGRLGDLRREASVVNHLAIVDTLSARTTEAELGFRHALDLHRRTGSRLGQATALLNIGVSLWCRARFAEAERLAEQSLELLRRLGSRRGQAVVLTNLAGDALAVGRPDEALRRLHAAEALTLAASGERPETDLLVTFAAAQLATEDLDGALAHAQAALAQAEAGRSQLERAQALVVLSRVYLARGDAGRALELGRAAVATSRASDLPLEQITGWLAVCHAAVQHQAPTEALDAARRAMARLRGCDLRVRRAEVLLALATARRATGDPALAGRYARAAAAEAADTGQHPLYDRARSLLDSLAVTDLPA